MSSCCEWWTCCREPDQQWKIGGLSLTTFSTNMVSPRKLHNHSVTFETYQSSDGMLPTRDTGKKLHCQGVAARLGPSTFVAWAKPEQSAIHSNSSPCIVASKSIKRHVILSRESLAKSDWPTFEHEVNSDSLTSSTSICLSANGERMGYLCIMYIYCIYLVFICRSNLCIQKTAPANIMPAVSSFEIYDLSMLKMSVECYEETLLHPACIVSVSFWETYFFRDWFVTTAIIREKNFQVGPSFFPEKVCRHRPSSSKL